MSTAGTQNSLTNFIRGCGCGK